MRNPNNPHEINNPGQCSFHYGYKDGYLKLVCYGGTGFMIKCKEEDSEDLIAPIVDYEFSESQCIDYCKKGGWETWDYYTDPIPQVWFNPPHIACIGIDDRNNKQRKSGWRKE